MPKVPVKVQKRNFKEQNQEALAHSKYVKRRKARDKKLTGPLASERRKMRKSNRLGAFNRTMSQMRNRQSSE